MNVRTAPGAGRAVPDGKDVADRRDGMDAHGEADRPGASVFGREAVADPSPAKIGSTSVSLHFSPGYGAGPVGNAG